MVQTTTSQSPPQRGLGRQSLTWFRQPQVNHHHRGVWAGNHSHGSHNHKVATPFCLFFGVAARSDHHVFLKAKAMQRSKRFQNCSAWWIPNTNFKINNDVCSMIRRCIKQQLSKLHSFHCWNHLYHCEFHQSTQYHTVFNLKACEQKAWA